MFAALGHALCRGLPGPTNYIFQCASKMVIKTSHIVVSVPISARPIIRASDRPINSQHSPFLTLNVYGYKCSEVTSIGNSELTILKSGMRSNVGGIQLFGPVCKHRISKVYICVNIIHKTCTLLYDVVN